MTFVDDIIDVVAIDSLINMNNSDYGTYDDVPDCYHDLGDAFDSSNIFGC